MNSDKKGTDKALGMRRLEKCKGQVLCSSQTRHVAHADGGQAEPEYCTMNDRSRSSSCSLLAFSVGQERRRRRRATAGDGSRAFGIRAPGGSRDDWAGGLTFIPQSTEGSDRVNGRSMRHRTGERRSIWTRRKKQLSDAGSSRRGRGRGRGRAGRDPQRGARGQESGARPGGERIAAIHAHKIFD